MNQYETLATAVRKVHSAKGRYHTQLAMCDLFDLLGLPSVRPHASTEAPLLHARDLEQIMLKHTEAVMTGNVTDREYCAWQLGYRAGVEFMPDEGFSPEIPASSTERS